MNIKHYKQRALIERAQTVFETQDGGTLKCIKSRYGDVIVGGIYERTFVEAYSKVGSDVYIISTGADVYGE